MNNIILINIDNSPDDGMDDSYEPMLYLLLKSIIKYNPVKIIGTYLKNDILSESIISILNDYNCEIIIDPLYDNDILSFDFLRHASIKYLIEHNYLDIYDNIIYLDIDVLILDKIPEELFNKNQIIVERVPDDIIIGRELKHLPNDYVYNPDNPLYYNWFQIINKYNRVVYDKYIISTESMIEKQSDIMISNIIKQSGINLIQNSEAYYPKKELKNNSFLIHYDSLTHDGSLSFLKKYNPMLYLELNLILKIKYNITLPITSEWDYQGL